jgi:hypothetical protein
MCPSKDIIPPKQISIFCEKSQSNVDIKIEIEFPVQKPQPDVDGILCAHE